MQTRLETIFQPPLVLHDNVTSMRPTYLRYAPLFHGAPGLLLYIHITSLLGTNVLVTSRYRYDGRVFVVWYAVA